MSYSEILQIVMSCIKCPFVFVAKYICPSVGKLSLSWIISNISVAYNLVCYINVFVNNTFCSKSSRGVVNMHHIFIAGIYSQLMC